MTDGNKTACRNVLLPADSNRVAYLPTDLCHIYQDVCYEQLTSLEEPKFFLYSCREMFCHTKKTHCDMHTNRPHFTESHNSGGQKGLLEIICCKPPAQSRAEQRGLMLRILSSLWQGSLLPRNLHGEMASQFPSTDPAPGYASAADPYRE